MWFDLELPDLRYLARELRSPLLKNYSVLMMLKALLRSCSSTLA